MKIGKIPSQNEIIRYVVLNLLQKFRMTYTNTYETIHINKKSPIPSGAWDFFIMEKEKLNA